MMEKKGTTSLAPFYGTVIDIDGHPVTGATVALFQFYIPGVFSIRGQDRPQPVHTLADGSFEVDDEILLERLRELPNGGRDLTAAMAAILVDTGDRIILKTLKRGVRELIKPEPTNTVTIRLVAPDGTAATGIRTVPVSLLRDDDCYYLGKSVPDRWLRPSSDDGIITWTGVPSGYHLCIMIVDDRYCQTEEKVYVAEDVETTMIVVAGGEITGRVRFPEPDQIDTSITVQVSPVNGTHGRFQAQLDETGRYHLDRLPPGSYRLTISGRELRWTTDDAPTVGVLDGIVTSAPDIALYPNVLIAGKLVRNDADRTPVAHHKVHIHNVPGVKPNVKLWTVTDEFGGFRSHVPPAGQYVVTAIEGNLYARIEPAILGGHPVDLVLEPGHLGDVAGKVTDQDGTPIEGASISLSVWDEGSGHGELEVRTDAAGRYRIVSVLPFGNYTVHASANGHESSIYRPSRLVEPNKTLRVNFKLNRLDRRIDVVLVDVDGKPIQGASVHAEGNPEVVTDRHGRFAFLGSDGENQFSVRPTGGGFMHRMIGAGVTEITVTFVP